MGRLIIVRVNRVLITAAAAVLLLAGCGNDVPSTDGDDPTSSATGTPTSPSDEPSVPTDEPTGPPTGDPSVPPDPTGEPTGPGTTPDPTAPETPVPQPTTTPGGSVELTGFPVPGVEAGCWLLDGYLLMGGDQDLIASGREVQVTGEVQTDVMTTCQQGTPLRVDSVVGIEP